MEKNYNSQKFEQEIYEMWENKGYFKAKIDKNKKPFIIIMPPPNANGVLHIGHAVFVALQDIMVRYHRMKGDSALWVPGFDHAGIMTQVVYEKKLSEKGKTRFDLGREEFIKQTYKFSMENKEIMKSQLKKIGASCDWEKEKFTLEPNVSKIVLRTFKKLYDDGLIYKGERIINWCPRCETALSDLEVIHKETQGKLYYIKYPIQDSNEFITIATTRPETMLGDTAVAVNPKDKRYAKFLGRDIKIKLPLLNRIIPLIFDDKISIEFGTGAVKITPAHDALDFEIGKRHKLEIISVIGKDLKMLETAGEKYKGLKTNKCREMVLRDLEKLGLLIKQEDYNIPISKCERCKSKIEPIISKQWFIKIKSLVEPAIKAVKSKQIKFVPQRYEKQFFHWMENIHDWCISRQLWWGHRIPVYYCECGEIIVSVDRPKKCPKCGSKNIKQDTDTLDTWFSSGQWPFAVFLATNNSNGEIKSKNKELIFDYTTKEFEYFYPTSVMETGWDILFFWVARMIMLGIYCTGKPPFKYVYLHGLVRDKDKQKMSKSKGNVIDPLGVINEFGADALRMALVFGSGPGNDIIISEEKIIGQKRFANKIWNATRFVLTQCEIDKKEYKSELELKQDDLTKQDKNILDELNKTIKLVSENIEKFQFHQSAEILYHFFWHKFCDKYIEESKKQIQEGSREQKQNTQRILIFVLATSMKLLHPFMPFITEKIFQMLPLENKNDLIVEKWPEYK